MQGNQGCFQESANVLAMNRKLKHDTKTDLYLNKFYCALMPHFFFFFLKEAEIFPAEEEQGQLAQYSQTRPQHQGQTPRTLEKTLMLNQLKVSFLSHLVLLLCPQSPSNSNKNSNIICLHRPEISRGESKRESTFRGRQQNR